MDDYLKVKKVLVDFVSVRYPLFKNLFDDEKNLKEILLTIDNNWIPATPTQNGLFSYEDKQLLQQLAETNGIDLEVIRQNLQLKNIRNIQIPESSSLTINELNDKKISLDIDETDLFSKIEFNSSEYNSGVQIEFNQGVFEIKSKNIVYISSEYKTNYIIPHNLGTNINVNVFYQDDVSWKPVYAPIEITNNKVFINFSEAVKCKVHLTLI